MSACEVLARAEALYKDRERFERLLDIGVELLRDALVLRETGDEQLLVDEQGADLHRQWAERFPLPAAASGTWTCSREAASLLEKRVARTARGGTSAHGAGELTLPGRDIRQGMSEENGYLQMTEETLDKTMKIAGVRFRENWKVYDFDATDMELCRRRPGDR